MNLIPIAVVFPLKSWLVSGLSNEFSLPCMRSVLDVFLDQTMFFSTDVWVILAGKCSRRSQTQRWDGKRRVAFTGFIFRLAFWLSFHFVGLSLPFVGLSLHSVGLSLHSFGLFLPFVGLSLRSVGLPLFLVITFVFTLVMSCYAQKTTFINEYIFVQGCRGECKFINLH